MSEHFRHRNLIKFSENKWIQKSLNPTNALWKDLTLHQLNTDLILDSNQGLAFYRQKQILRYDRHKNLQNQNNEDFFIQLLNDWMHFTSNEKILDQPISLTPHTKLNFTSNNHVFIAFHPKIYQTNLL